MLDVQKFTAILHRASGGDEKASDQLFVSIYGDLRRLASNMMDHESSGHTLQPTALVHEAFLKLVDQSAVDWKNRSHFFAVGATAMRRILVNHAVAKKREKHGGAAPRVLLEEGLLSTERDEDVLAIDDALNDLAKLNTRHAKIVEYRFFGGLLVEEIATVMGVSDRTIRTEWRLCRAWLRQRLED